MRSWKALGAAAAIAVLLPAPPAAAQERSRRVAEDIAREIRNTAEQIEIVRDAVDDSVRGARFRGPERYAIERCAPYVERYGRMRVEDVRRHDRRSHRVYGTVEGGRYDTSYRDRYDRRDRYEYRSFTCTVRYDGRVKLKTKRYRR